MAGLRQEARVLGCPPWLKVFLFFVFLAHLHSKEELSVLQRQVGIMDSVTYTSLLPSPGGPSPIFPTHHQDPIGDDFRWKHLAAKGEELMGHLAPANGYYNKAVGKS
jgi:hypothetical protein